MTKTCPARRSELSTASCRAEGTTDGTTDGTSDGPTVRLPRGRLSRFWPLSLILLALGCSQNSEKIGKNQPPPPPPRPLDTQFAEPRQEETERDRLARGTPPGVSGEIDIAPELRSKLGPNAVLFVFARRPSGGPIAAKRLARPEFPVRFFLGQEAVMFEGEELSGEVEVEVRISQSGTAGPATAGDLSGEPEQNPLKVGDSQIHEIVIDTVQ